MTFLDSPMADQHLRSVRAPSRTVRPRDGRGSSAEHKSPFDLPGLKLIPHGAGVEDHQPHPRVVRSSWPARACARAAGSSTTSTHNIPGPKAPSSSSATRPQGTLGRQIADGAKEVRILGQTYPVRARVARIDGFSGHADRDELLRWLGEPQGAAEEDLRRPRRSRIRPQLRRPGLPKTRLERPRAELWRLVRTGINAAVRKKLSRTALANILLEKPKEGR